MLAGEKEPRADLLAATLPWSFAVDNREDQVLEAVLESGMLVSRNPRTLACMAFFVGVARRLLHDAQADRSELLDSGMAFAEQRWTSSKQTKLERSATPCKRPNDLTG